MASQAASNFNLPFLSPKSRSPSRAGALHGATSECGSAGRDGGPGAWPVPPAQRNQQLPAPKLWSEPGTSIASPGRAGARPCPPPAQAPHTVTEDAGTPSLPPLIRLFGGSCPWQAPAPNPVWNLKLPKSLLGLATASSIPLEVLCQRRGSRAASPALDVGRPHLWVSENPQTATRRGLGTPRLPPSSWGALSCLVHQPKGPLLAGWAARAPSPGPGTARTATAPTEPSPSSALGSG